MEKEEYVVVLDYLSHGYPLEKNMMPIAQAIGIKNFTLLQIVPRRNVKLEIGEKVYIGEGKRDKVYYILGRLPDNKITETTKQQLNEFISKTVSENENKFVEFFNKAEPINKRLHQLGLLPGFGKKHTEAIIIERGKSLFNSFNDLKNRVTNLPDPKKAIEKRFLEEVIGNEKYCLFVKNSKI